VSVAKPEASSLAEGEEASATATEKQQESQREDPAGLEHQESELLDQDETTGKKYVVNANINSQNEDFTFLVTALYHWEISHPAIRPTQPTDPK